MKNQTAAALLIWVGVLASGCASTNGAPNNKKDDEPAQRSQLVRATPRGTPEIEPTVVSGGGGSGPGGEIVTEYDDPLISVNRAIFTFNDYAYRYALIPASKAYVGYVPEPVKLGIGNFFRNIKSPVYIVNDALQLEPTPLGRHFARFAINTTLGVAGFFDPAAHWFGIEQADTDFGKTLMFWGAGRGYYLVLPFLGPSDVRGTTSLVVDYFLNPIPYITDNPDTTFITTFDQFQEFAPGAENYETFTNTLRGNLSDPYIFFRNLYLQAQERDANN